MCNALGTICGTSFTSREKLGPKLARYSFEDLFGQNVDKIYMTARDTTVKIVCDMGGEIIGEPQSFYEGNVTPVVLKRENYKRNKVMSY